MSTDDVAWTEAETGSFAVAIIDNDTDAVMAWLAKYATTWRAEYALLGALPQWCAILIRQIEPNEDGGMWALLDMGATATNLGLGQMLTAALNDDMDALFGHVDALIERPKDERAEVLAQLMAAFRDFGKIVMDRKAAS